MNLNFSALRQEELVSNPTPRVPVCLCLDVSGSMSGQPIQELNKGIQLFYDAIRNDEAAFYSAEISIVTFGGTKAQAVKDFASLQIEPNPPILQASGLTPMGEAVNLALDLLEQRKSEYQDAGVDYYQPWLVLMTDGAPNGSASEQDRAIRRVTTLVNTKKLTVFPIGIGRDADMYTLGKFSPKRDPLKLIGLNFSDFFEWLSQSVTATSQSMLGESVPLPPPNGWATLD